MEMFFFSFFCSVLPGLLLNCLVTNHSSTITSRTIARISEAVLVQADRSHPIGIKYILLSGLASLAPNFKTSSSRVCPSSSSSSCPFDLDNTNTSPPLPCSVCGTSYQVNTLLSVPPSSFTSFHRVCRNHASPSWSANPRGGADRLHEMRTHLQVLCGLP